MCISEIKPYVKFRIVLSLCVNLFQSLLQNLENVLTVLFHLRLNPRCVNVLSKSGFAVTFGCLAHSLSSGSFCSLWGAEQRAHGEWSCGPGGRPDALAALCSS